MKSRDPRTKTGPGPKKEKFRARSESWIRPEIFGKSRTETDQDQQNLENLGPNRTRTSKILKISDRTGPGPAKFRKSRTEPDQDQQNLKNLGPNRTRTKKKIRKSRTKSDRSVLGPGGSWIPAAYITKGLWTKRKDIDSIAQMTTGFEDTLQMPLQPLMDHLESCTYEVFEKG